ncbi:MAG: hypothetical protein Q9227_002902 [Pyrenula ochraceoflavens]
MSGIQVLPPGFGYGIVIGIGGFFAALMLGITFLQNRYTMYSTGQSEEFNTASRNVKPGLIAAGIVSSWTWSATLLTSSTFAYSYGICGPMWYGASGTFQILLFGLIAIKIKANAPGAHTFPEILYARHGIVAHITYLFNGFATNMLVGACLNLGGSQVVGALTGMNVYAACFLIPLVVGAYVIAGGLRSTFLCDYIHTVILFLSIFIFGFTLYATSPIVGSLDKFYDLLLSASEKMPIAKNASDGSYLTFHSVDGLVFAVDLLVAGFSTVWLDQAYWQRAIASRPETSVRAYILGGISWYGIPFGFATAMGLGCAALTGSKSFPTYPNPLSDAQNGAGLSSPATAIALLGKGGAGLMLLLLFMAVTSSTSAELIAVSSLITFDIYKTYIHPSATSKQLVTMSHAGIIIYALVLAVFCCILNVVNINLTWLLTVLGIIVGGASVPVGLVLLWSRMSTVATITAPYIGLAFGLISWFVTTKKRSGSISVETTGDVTNAVAGNLASWGGGAVVAVVLTLIFPKKYSDSHPDHVARNRKIMGIATTDVGAGEGAFGSDAASPNGVENPEQGDKEVKAQNASNAGESSPPPTESKPEALAPTGNELVDYLEAKQIEPMDPAQVSKSQKLATYFNWTYFFIALILVPFALFGVDGDRIFSRATFKGWVVMSFLWVWVSMVICVIYPVVESAGALGEIGKGVIRDLGGGGRRRKTTQGEKDGGNRNVRLRARVTDGRETTRFMRLSLTALACATACLLPTAHSVFSDEAFQVDWHYALLGVPQPHATFFHRPSVSSSATLLYTASEKGVLGAVNPKDGALVWRQPLRENRTVETNERTFLVPGEGLVVSASENGVTAWDPTDGRLVWNAPIGGAAAPKDLKRVPKDGSAISDFVVLYHEEKRTLVQRLDGITGKVMWEFSDRRGDSPLVLATDGSTVYYASSHHAALGQGNMKVSAINALTGQEAKGYTLNVDVSHCPGPLELKTSQDTDAPVLALAEHSSKEVLLNVLGSTKIETIQIDGKSGEEVEEIEVHLSKSPRILIHARSKTHGWAEVYQINAKSSSTTKAYSIPAIAEQDIFTAAAAPGPESHFVRITTSEVSLFSSESHGILGRWPRSSSTNQSIVHAAAEVVARSATSFAVRVAGTSTSGEWSLIRNGESVWSRYEDLSNAVAAAWADTDSAVDLAQQLELESHSSLFTAYLHRVKRHLQDLADLPRWLQSIPQSIINQFLGGSTSDQSYLTSRKAVIIATDGWLYSLDMTNAGKILWRTQIPVVGNHRSRLRDLSVDEQQGTLRIDGAVTINFNIDRGDIVAMKPCSHFSKIVDVPTTSGSAAMHIPENGLPQGLTGINSEGNFLISLNGDQKVQGWSLTEQPRLLWTFSPTPGFRIIQATYRPVHDPVASIGKVLGDRTVLYKYLSSNIALVTTVSADALTIYLLDGITGSVLHSVTETSIDTTSPVVSIISENWFAYTFFGTNAGPVTSSSTTSQNDAKAHHLTVTELYESPHFNDRGPLGSSPNASAFTPPGILYPHSISQSFVISQPISQLAVTTTMQGITSRSLLAYLPQTSALVAIPRPILDPRRPVGRDPTPAEVEEGLFRYNPFLEFDSKWYLSHSRDILGVDQILSTPTVLESSSLVFTYGHDLFGTRVAPSMTFDVLGKGFSKGALLGTVVALGMGVLALRPVVRKKMVAGRWKGQ